mmetsp:Transcript_94317/g.219155  ORF Transcript_94317/g.219155 Transcript_94317/m.219155 type:complete len:123 (-) Transcript_94317:61-429(-)|eukprot:CAMPEP_0171099822 /NCGR_PEP_ID=MMETSP0766_2-20121228/52594_1 /TAXON_ID=439317 /ORGANISM="Gambierdiscus australes, Strain CAWD 149" /LENGTH=122 /DNA_ID=CAMNT_0011559539 /DNA_START=58 /DNA_END=426 /DNA_ORIENTATION=-
MEGGALHTVERVLNTLDYGVIGLLTVGVALNAFTPVFAQTNASSGRIAVFIVGLYFYIRWQIDVLSIPMKTADPTDAEKAAFFRATRDVFMEFSGFILVLFNFAVAKLRVDIEDLKENTKIK